MVCYQILDKLDNIDHISDDEIKEFLANYEHDESVPGDKLSKAGLLYIERFGCDPVIDGFFEAVIQDLEAPDLDSLRLKLLTRIKKVPELNTEAFSIIHHCYLRRHPSNSLEELTTFLDLSFRPNLNVGLHRFFNHLLGCFSGLGDEEVHRYIDVVSHHLNQANANSTREVYSAIALDLSKRNQDVTQMRFNADARFSKQIDSHCTERDFFIRSNAIAARKNLSLESLLGNLQPLLVRHVLHGDFTAEVSFDHEMADRMARNRLFIQVLMSAETGWPCSASAFHQLLFRDNGKELGRITEAEAMFLHDYIDSAVHMHVRWYDGKAAYSNFLACSFANSVYRCHCFVGKISYPAPRKKFNAFPDLIYLAEQIYALPF